MFEEFLPQNKKFTVEERSQSDCICSAKPKTTIFENRQFSRHLVSDKKKTFFYPDKQELCFFGKGTFSFLKKNVFFQNFKKFSAHNKFVKIFYKFFRTKISKKNIFFSKKKGNCFFFLNKNLVYRGKKVFFSPKKYFCLTQCVF